MARILYWLAPFYTAGIIVLSLMDQKLPVVNLSNIDKLFHAIAYAIMTVLWYLFFYSRYLNNSGMGSFNLSAIFKNWSKTIAIAAGALSFIIGFLVELGQEYIALNRTMDLLDGLANSTGIIIASLLLYLLSRKFNAD